MSTNVTNDDIRAAISKLHSFGPEFPRYCMFRGIELRIISNTKRPEFLNDQGKWQVLELSETMKPCPFCGSTNIDPEEVMQERKDGTRYSYPGCVDCGASCPKWNERA